MKMTFDVGQSERHRVEFGFDKMWGRLTIEVDGRSVVDTVQLFSVSLVRVWEFPVGEAEVHAVRIEKQRALVLSFLRPQPVRAYVDGQLVAEGVA